MQMRIAYIARQRRALTKAIVREAVERYIQALADEIASGEWVDLPGIGKIQVIQEAANGVLTSFGKDSQRVQRRVTYLTAFCCAGSAGKQETSVTTVAFLLDPTVIASMATTGKPMTLQWSVTSPDDSPHHIQRHE